MKVEVKDPGPILEEACGYVRSLGIKVATNEILSKSRREDVVLTRALVCYVLREKGYSFGRIGGILNKDHATIIHTLGGYPFSRGAQKLGFKKYRRKLQTALNTTATVAEIQYHTEQLSRLLKLNAVAQSA